MKRTIPALAAIILLFSAGCAHRSSGGQDAAGSTANSETATATPQGSGWYYFSDAGIHPAPNPMEIPARSFLPWTEAVRVSDAAIVNGSPAFLINKLGLMTSGADGKAPALRTDALFASHTAAGIYETENGPAVRLYRNSFFAGSAAAAGSAANAGAAQGDGICLAGFDAAAGTFTAAMTARDFGLDADAQCVALDRIGSMWYASFKLEKSGKVDFTYLEFESFPAKKGDTFDLSGVKKLSSESYQKSVTPFGWKDAPDALKSALSGIPETTAFNLKVYSADGKSSQTYIRQGDGTPVDGTAFIGNGQTAVLFADGTFCFQGKGADGKAQTLKLPALSTGYVYTSFLISGKSLLAAWEEQRFFETGRAGILVTTLPDAIY